MTAATFLSDLLAVSVQMASVILVAAALARVVRVDAAVVRYQYWRALLLFCLLLPWMQRRQATASVVETIAFPTANAVVFAPASGVAASAPGIPWIAIAMWILLAGIAIRLVRVGYGVVRLRNIRRAGELAPPSDDHDDLQRVLGTQAEIRYVRNGHPVTCGFWRPVVLLPEELTWHSQEIQRAVLAHELLHVQRRDWIWVMGEELLRSVFWFHPGVWWLVGRVRLAREEVVDELTVSVTGRRRTYLEALLAFADAAPFAPGAAFARRRHLFRRMTLISKEAVMSSRRIVVSCAVLVLGVAVGSWYTLRAFPLMAQAQGIQSGSLEQNAKPITPENPIPRRTYSVMPPYPGGAPSDAAVVTLRVTLNALGRVAEVRTLGRTLLNGDVQFVYHDQRVLVANEASSGPIAGSEIFTNAAVNAVRQWVYDPPADAPISFDVSLVFGRGTDTRLVAHGGPLEQTSTVSGVVGGVAPPPPPPPPPPPWTREGATIANPVRIGGAIQPPTKTKQVAAVYPPLALSAKVTGDVIVEAIIGPEGRVDQVRVLQSIPMLDAAAMDAVKQWEFTPTLMNGVPVPVIITAVINFTLK